MPASHCFTNQLGRGCSSVGRASDRHAADADSIPRCGKGFFSQCQLSVHTLLLMFVYPPCAIACFNICVHVKDAVVHVRVRWIAETLKYPACAGGWVARLCRSWLSSRKATRISHGIDPNGTTQFIRIIIINPLPASVVGAPQMILQPVFSFFPCSPLPSGTWRTPDLSIP